MSSIHDPLVTVEEAAELLGTDPRSIRRLIAERRLDFVKLGRDTRVAESALIQYAVAASGNGNSATGQRRRSA